MIAGPPPLPRASAPVVSGKLSIVVVNWNAAPFLERALRSIVRHTHLPYELVLVENGSTDGSKELVGRFVRAHPALAVRVLDFPENLYFSRGFNEGIRASAPDSEYVVVFCNDVEVKRDDWLDDMLRAAARPGVVAAGHAEPGRTLSDEQREILRRNAPAYEGAELRERMARLLDDPGATYTHLYGYCFLLARRALERSGLYLESGDFRQYHSDWEWCLRFAALGLEVADARPGVHHWHSVSELIAFHPQRYRELLARLDDAPTLARYLEEGRPLFAEESGYRAWAAQRRPRGEGHGDGE